MVVQLVLCGCNGQMGRVISQTAQSRADCRIVAGIDVNTTISFDYPVYSNPMQCRETADAVIDFSHPDAFESISSFAASRRLPLVIATTGLSDEQKVRMHALSADIPVFYSANMSLGINLLASLARKAAAVLGSDFDVEIVEKHHNQKVDAPSGTALMLADSLSQGLSYTPEYVFDRHGVRRKREKNEIGFASVRAGNIVGEHEIIFAGKDEVVTLTHQATSKEVFAEGAIGAALYLMNRPAGFYSMEDLVNDIR